MSEPFVHLHCHSHYSLLDGAGSIDRLLERARALGMTALALTDHGNLYGALEFYQKAKAAEIKPIVGYEAYVAPASRFQREASSMKEASFHLTLLAQNRTGFQNLLKLASTAYLDGFYFRPRIDKQVLKDCSEGLICLSGCASSELNRVFLDGNQADLRRAAEVADWFRSVFGDRYFIEIQDNGLDLQKQTIPPAVELGRRMGIPLVATSDVHYVMPEDADAQDILLCVNTGKFRTDQKRMRMETKEFYLRGPDEMYARFSGLEDAVRRSGQIADMVKIDLELGKRHFPIFTPPEGAASEDYLRELCLRGLKERYRGKPSRCADGGLSQEVTDRLDRELSVINKLGFPNYFLIVWDFVRHARSKGIEATARGSGVGSLVAYSLYLSHVCPLEYDLLFERFLDESRKEAPDIDIDFCQERRGEVIQYVKEQYGTDNVAQIGTFGTLQARAAIRDVGRALGLPIPRVNAVVAMVPEQLHITIQKALEKSDDLRKTYESDGEVRELLDLAMRVEGLARNVGTHAAAVVIADRPLVEYLPLQRVQNKEEVITQWAMADVEKAGLLKMDFLGLRNLTILSKVVKLIEQTTGRKINPYEFPLDDRETFALLCRGETKGVFQLESGGIRDLLQRMKPDHFRDIIATNALYRPGPLEGGMVDDYIEIKHGRRQATYPHPVMKEVLEETHGVMVFQEQVMLILYRLGGIKLANAYTCIKAIGKKKLPIIARFREEFVVGAQERGLGKTEAEELFGLIEKFAGYGFNKCVVGDTVVIDADTGERATVEELFHNRRPFRVHSLGDDGKLHLRRVTDVVWNGRKRVYRLTTVSGRQLTATANHPLRTISGWTHLADLKPGDRIAAPRRMSVVPHVLGREEQARQLRRQIDGAEFDRTSKDTIPAGVRQFVDEERRRLGITWRELERRSGICMKEFAGRGSKGKRGFRRSTIQQLAMFFHSSHLEQLAASDVFWDTVVAIEPQGVQDTYDLTVERDHNFVADGLIVHNSHSTAYALVAYMTAYLKAHWPVEFMAALLSSDMANRNFKTKDSLVEHLEDCQRMRIDVVSPDVNRCGPDFSVAEGKILFGLAAIKGCGWSAAEAICAARAKGGPFKSLFDFCERLDPGAVNRTAIEALIKAGAFDRLGARRAQWFAVIEKALQSGASAAADRRAGQRSLFGDDEAEDPRSRPVNLPDVPEWDERDKLGKEKEVLGFYASSHPLAQHAQTLSIYCTHTTSEAAALPHRTDVMLGGMLAAIKLAHTKNPRPGMPSKYAMFDLEDMAGIMRCILWPEQYAQYGALVVPDAILGVQGVIDKRPGSEEANLIVNQLIPLDELPARFTRGIVVRLNEEQHDVAAVEKLYEILRGYPGPCEVQLLVALADGSRIVCSCDRLRVEINPEMRRRIEELLGPGNVRLLASPPAPSPQPRRNGQGGRGRN